MLTMVLQRASTCFRIVRFPVSRSQRGFDMIRSNVAADREFPVTISRIPTSDMVYAMRQKSDGTSELFVVMTDVIEGLAEFASRLRVNAILTVEVDSSDPEVVVRARFPDAARSHGSEPAPVRSALGR